jgi:hypothetical protein
MKKHRTAVLAAALFLSVAVSGCGSSGKSMDMGDLGLAQQLTGLIGKLTGSLGGITSPDAAQAALPALEAIDTELGGLVNRATGESPEVRRELADVAGNALPDIESLAAQAMAIPGVSDLIGSTMGSITGKLNGLI